MIALSGENRFTIKNTLAIHSVVGFLPMMVLCSERYTRNETQTNEGLRKTQEYTRVLLQKRA
jgi:hypothetical protein